MSDSRRAAAALIRVLPIGLALGMASVHASDPVRTDRPTSASGTLPFGGREDPARLETLGDFTDGLGFRRLYVRVPAGLSDGQLVALARQVHEREKTAWLWLLDSDEKAGQMMAALPKAAQGDFKDYPADWVARHTAAHSELQLLPQGGRRWALFKGPESGTLLGVLPCRGGGRLGC